VEEALVRHGWAVRAQRTADVRGFTTAVTCTSIDVVICDCDTPGLRDVQVLDIARSIDSCLPFVFVSALAGEERAAESMRAGADGYLLRSELHQLGRVVERALADGQLRRERERAERSLRENEQRLRAMIDSAVDAVIAIDGSGCIRSFNPAAEQMFGYRPAEVLGRNVRFLMPEPYHSEHDGYLQRYLATGQRRIIGIGREVVAVRRNGDVFPVELSISEATLDESPLFTGVMRDVSERKRLEAALVEQAMHDHLTGLPNRALFLDRLNHASARAERREGLIAVLFLDLDRFKMINDTLGHATGDGVLKEAGRRLTSSLRPSDTVARFGGDEFVVLCEDISGEAEASAIAGRLEESLRAPFLAGEAEIFVSASLGIAVGPGAEGPTLLRNADTAMYGAKERGRGRNELYDDAMRARARERLEVERDLHRALERGEFRLHYQPEVTVGTGRAVGFEALLRWEHPDRGLLGPDRFLEVAEDTGLIVPIGAWVLGEACRQAVEWGSGSAARSTVWVNVSARELAHPAFLDTVSAALERHGAGEGTIGVEMTESTLMEDAKETVATTSALRDLGIPLSIDDFGTGYSSLSYLKRFPVDTLKVDRSFVDGLGSDDDDRSIVAAVIGLADSLRLDVVAEGVETPEQLDVLQDLGCGFAQGYLIARPSPPDQARHFLPT
jgi:diguanylate cyclase (GGDEF)-like protein/PAS domain S-box-containing protein